MCGIFAFINTMRCKHRGPDNTHQLWRQKEAFSDGVSSQKKSWFSIIHNYLDGFIREKDPSARTLTMYKK